MRKSSNDAKVSLTPSAKRQHREARLELAKALREIAAEMQRPDRHRLPGHQIDDEIVEEEPR
ncbi:MAG: hypothetical protein JO196_10725 [Hyphomicrobiales bacterium]|nr:hypothetical protein [Hyphomicrobiales bacterium]MBV9973972.1 hypothetical protein [Hyphomicrobiales bacterium]